MVEKLKQLFGVDHLKTLTALSQLANTYNDLGQHEKALPLLREIWEIRQESLGEEHPVSRRAQHNLILLRS